MAAEEPIQVSYLSWLFQALGFKYAVLLPLAGLISFLIATTIVLRGKGPIAAAGLILVVHVPFLIGLFAAMEGIAASYRIIAMSETPVKPSELALGISMALAAPMVGMLLMVPGYAVGAVGALIRTFAEAGAEESAPTTHELSR
jgi:hypothetical protein